MKEGIEAFVENLEEGITNAMEEKAEQIRNRFALLEEQHTFKPGDLIEFKPGLKNKRIDFYVVQKVLDGPVYDPNAQAGTPYFREPLDLIAGSLDPDGDLILLHLDSRRVRPVQF